MKPAGFDNELYLKEQSEAILGRIKNSRSDKLYLEFGGKILFDYHAARVLPGFDTNVKMKLLSMLKDSVEVIMCEGAGGSACRQADTGWPAVLSAAEEPAHLREETRAWTCARAAGRS